MKIFIIVFLIIISTVLPISDGDFFSYVKGGYVYQEAVKMDFMLMKQDDTMSIEFLYEHARHMLKREKVIVSAYNNLESQTDSTPNICAWNDPIRPGIIAVTRDLEKAGLGRNTEVIVEGIGKVTVLDRMNKRHKKRVDVFMGKDKKTAINFGIKKLNIYWKE